MQFSSSNHYKTIGQYLWTWRRTYNGEGMTLEDVAGVAGAHPDTWSRYEKGRGSPDAVHLKNLYDAFGLMLPYDEI